MLLAALVSILTACGGSGNASGGGGSNQNITIGFIPGVTTDPFFISMQAGAQAEAQKLGVKLLWQGASQYTPSQQTPYVDSLVSRHVSALAIAPTDATAMIPPIQRAVNAKIPVIAVDSTITNKSLLTAEVTADNVQGGTAAADILAKQINDKGTVVVLAPTPGITTDNERVQGFEQEIKKYPNINFVGVQYDNEQNTKAATLAQQMILRYPNLAGIFGTDDTSASGAATGVRSAGKTGKVQVVAYDAEPEEVTDLQSGLISALIAQKPYEEGQLAVQYAYDAATGKTSQIKKSTVLANVTIDKSNLSQNQQWVYKSKA
jgi:ribose transport system substrate-binding protein